VTFVFTEEVVIRWRNDHALAASVRAHDGIHDVTFTADGWACTCPESYGCVHILAVKGIAAVAS